MTKLLSFLIVLFVDFAATNLLYAAPASSAAGSFADNPIVYFVMTDRFLDGNPANNESYGRKRESTPAADVGTFHGGDLAGISKKLKEGYFAKLGINAIWITAPYEQIRGWVVGGNKEFKHYAYHGYYALDYTVLDKNMGNGEELREMVDTAHSQGIRILFDVVINHPGYGDLWSLNEFKVGVLWPEWEKATLRDYHSYIDYNNPKWLDWWGRDWIRSGLRGYDEVQNDASELTKQLAYLPDFKTESPKAVDLPPLLKIKPDTRAKPIAGATVRQYLVAWLTQWVRDYGIDGFRCDTVKHVEPASWLALKQSGKDALTEWKKANPGKKIDEAAFWMTGEFWGHGVERSDLFDAGFDNMINFDFQDRATSLGAIDKIYGEYAAKLAVPATHNVLSYLSSHDTKLYDRKKLMDGATMLLLAPGGVQIYYGDETARPPGPLPTSDPQQATRSDMNWDAIDSALFAHWQRLGQFRARHVALAKGVHRRLADTPYTFSRIHPTDRIVAALGVSAEMEISVGEIFSEGATLREAYGGSEVRVKGGKVRVKPHLNGVILLEQMETK